jgi:RNA polymerase sigma factor (sigma-70 family)
MTDADLISALAKSDKVAKKLFFERYYPSLAVLAMRYAKSEQQGKALFNQCFSNVLQAVLKRRSEALTSFDGFVKKTFIQEAIFFLKQQRNEYYVASTVKATESQITKNYDLFKDHQIVDFNALGSEELIIGLQKLVPSQRLVFNLYVVDGFTLLEVSELLETSEQTVKSNLEKSRYNLQKNLESTLKQLHNEHAL